MTREGPYVQRSCSGCKWLDGESYRCQGDSGVDYYCTHQSLATKPRNDRHVGDSRTITPDWCPFLQPAATSVPTIEPRYCDCTSFCMRQSKNIDPRLCKAARAGLETSSAPPRSAAAELIAADQEQDFVDVAAAEPPAVPCPDCGHYDKTHCLHEPGWKPL